MLDQLNVLVAARRKHKVVLCSTDRVSFTDENRVTHVKNSADSILAVSIGGLDVEALADELVRAEENFIASKNFTYPVLLSPTGVYEQGSGYVMMRASCVDMRPDFTPTSESDFVHAPGTIVVKHGVRYEVILAPDTLANGANEPLYLLYKLDALAPGALRIAVTPAEAATYERM